MKTYEITYKISITVDAENEDEAMEIADRSWWSDGEVIDAEITEI